MVVKVSGTSPPYPTWGLTDDWSVNDHLQDYEEALTMVKQWVITTSCYAFENQRLSTLPSCPDGKSHVSFDHPCGGIDIGVLL
jgi:hypothetical protein